MKVKVKVIPRSSRTELVGTMDDGTLRVKVAAVPEKGQANVALCDFLAQHFRVPRNQVEVASGHTASIKIVRVGNDEKR